MFTWGIGAASTIQGIVILPPTGARVNGANGCLSKLGTKAAIYKHKHKKKQYFIVSTIIFTIISEQIDKKLPGLKHRKTTSRPTDKSVSWKFIFFISHPKHMLCILKRTVSMRRFF